MANEMRRRRPRYACWGFCAHSQRATPWPQATAPPIHLAWAVILRMCICR